ncbi:beta-lactamase [Mycobacteroides abscessus subsp. abscessus]|nr:beta-lactamase [Mycobacteroides abscessus subsp. abscessus]
MGWDIDTELSKPRGMLFPIGSFGHQRGGPPIVRLSGHIATVAARMLDLYRN